MAKKPQAPRKPRKAPKKVSVWEQEHNSIDELLTATRDRILAESIWIGSKYEIIKSMASKTIGCFGEAFVKTYLREEGFVITKRKSVHSDITVNGLSVEVKTSSCWDNKLDAFTWQQVRSGQSYQIVVFLGINPNESKMYWATKDDLQKIVFGNDDYRQHAGKEGNQELYWFTKGREPWMRDISELKQYVGEHGLSKVSE